MTPQGWLKDGSVLICDGKILEVTNSDLAVIGATVIDARGITIVPGFVSMHAHGGGGHDYTEATEEAFRTATTAHLKHGATGIFPTLSSTSFERIYQAVDVCENLMKEKDSPVLGLHIEGPYLNPKMAGTQYDGFLKTPDENEYIPLLARTSCIRRWDISPELPGAHDFAKYTRSKGIMTAVTHTEAEYDEIKAAYAVGFSHAAHFYNAMPGFHKRREYKYEGTVESIGLIDDMTALMELPDETVLEMLTAEAEVVAAAQQSEAQSMGVYATGKTAGSISYDKKLKVKGASRAIYVSPKGTRSDGNKRRNAEVAFVNEYGKAGQPARPFINTANEKSADAAVEAAAGVYDKYLKSKNL